MRLNGKAFRFYFECEAFRLALSSRLNFEFNSARNLIGVHNLELLLSTLRVLRGN
jgi:hypothetical protein